MHYSFHSFSRRAAVSVCPSGPNWFENSTALYNAATTDACLEILDTAGLREPVLQSLLADIQLHLDRRAGGAFRVGAVLFSNQHGPLGQTETAARLLNEWKE